MSSRPFGLHVGITGKVAAVFVLFGATLLAAVTWFAYLRGSEALRDAAAAGLVSVALEKERAIRTWVESAAHEMRALANDPHLPADVAGVLGRGRPARDAHARLVEDLRVRILAGSGFTALFVIEPGEGRVIAATDPDEEGKFKEDRAYFLRGRTSPYVQGPYYSLQRRGPAMVVSAPVRSPDGALVAVVAGWLQLDGLGEIVKHRSGLHRSDDAFLVNADNLAVTRPRFLEDAQVLARGFRTTALNRCLAGESGTVMAEDYRGIPALLAFRWMPERGLCLIVKLDQAEALGPVVALRRTLLAFGGGALVVASVLAVGLGRAMARPVRGLTAGAARIGRGDLDVRLPDASGDELGLLAREFNAMAGALAEREERLGQAAEALRQSNRELEAFSYSVSHDLRAPLRALDGFSRILLERHAGHIPEEARRYLGMIRDNAKQMGRLVDDLLHFSRLGRQPLETRPVEPGEIVRRALDDLRAEREGRKVDITVGDLPGCQADPALLRQVFVNLLSNALKFTRGRAAAEIEIGCREAGGTRAYFVRDNGAGFDMRYADKLFGVFQRLHRAEDFEGTGVGLAIVQRIVQRHGGRVWAEALVDRGATFYFTLEREASDDR